MKECTENGNIKQ